MPAFGKDGIKNLNPVTSKVIWEIVASDGKVVATCDENSVESQKQALSQKLNQELTARQRTLKCL